jgi:hypothetical protein
MTQPTFDWDSVTPSTLVVAPSVYPQARETSGLAAVANGKARGRQNVAVLAAITAGGSDGLSDEEISHMTGLSRQTVCLRRFDLRGLIAPGTRRAVSRYGRAMTTWVRKEPE